MYIQPFSDSVGFLRKPQRVGAVAYFRVCVLRARRKRSRPYLDSVGCEDYPSFLRLGIFCFWKERLYPEKHHLHRSQNQPYRNPFVVFSTKIRSPHAVRMGLTIPLFLGGYLQVADMHVECMVDS